jgi:hypothetical protein
MTSGLRDWQYLTKEIIIRESADYGLGITARKLDAAQPVRV